jgi:hypothetical protein
MGISDVMMPGDRFHIHLRPPLLQQGRQNFAAMVKRFGGDFAGPQL